MNHAKPHDVAAMMPLALPPPEREAPQVQVAETGAVRARMPGEIIPSAAMHTLAAVARRWGRGGGAVTTEGEVEIGGIALGHVVDAMCALSEAGFVAGHDAPAADPCRAALRHGHVGVFPQTRRGMNDVGIAIPVGQLTAHQMDGLAHLATECGVGALRLTAWQNAVVPDVADERLGALSRRVRLMGLDIRAASAAAGVVACHDATGAIATHAFDLCRHLDRAVALDAPVDIHVSAGPCTHGAVADLCLVGAGGDAYDVIVGGGAPREVWHGLPAVDAPGAVARLLNIYLRRHKTGEGFLGFARRHEDTALRAMLAGA